MGCMRWLRTYQVEDMKKNRTPLELAIGKLIVALQQEWTRHMGEGAIWAESEAVMHRGHELLQHGKAGELDEFLNGESIEEFLGHTWIECHPQIRHFIRAIEKNLLGNSFLCLRWRGQKIRSGLAA